MKMKRAINSDQQSGQGSARGTINKSTSYGEPAQLYDVGTRKIKGLAPLTLPQTFLGLFNQRSLGDDDAGKLTR
jgi:hypothetical protein